MPVNARYECNDCHRQFLADSSVKPSSRLNCPYCTGDVEFVEYEL